ncbi:ATP-dependent DNA helicase RecQ [Shewanella sp. UCD-KL12]|uniref:RecQ family ATP-dependent DNA helicase n=1 Tax=Shewanella sp. UCD-KL12 TaxID=1917163 RepID=UPI0009714CFE|nr:ATP-dependent DNA helicase RecQ [Shewanella sp. UCD-KL12]
MSLSSNTRALTLLQSHFGFQQFREGQEQVISAILAGHSAAAIFPTGSGKSLCYQLPATVMPHLTLVVSPLLALMQDQLAYLAQRGIRAASIDSTQSREQANEVMKGIRGGQIKVLMISVERLNNERFRQFISEVPISLLVVDEAHCISEWGHNFRPDYLKLPKYQHELKIPQTLLLTATATPKVITDMGSKFGIDEANVTMTGFYRPNLHLGVIGVKSVDKVERLSLWLQSRLNQSGIIYVTLQQTAEQVAEQLSRRGISAKAYHAGMSAEVRTSIQQSFMAGKQQIIVATIAFGMGIDKSDIRFVVHYDLPKSIENYAQEIGRAGRDGGQSDCLVLANGDNLNTLENFVYGDTPESSDIATVLNEIRAVYQAQSKPAQFGKNKEWEVVLNSLSSQSNIRPLSLKTLLVYLELLKVIKPTYSYFAEYKFKLLNSESEIMAAFNAERSDFIRAIFNSSDKAKIWSTVNFDKLNQVYASDRQRVLKAINYLDEKGMIELQSKQMTQVYEVLGTEIDVNALQSSLFERFRNKEQSEVARINHLVAFFTSNHCLSQQLAHYFADTDMQQPCGTCSVCLGDQAILPPQAYLQPLDALNFTELTRDASNKLGNRNSAVLLARFLCGLTTPIFTRLKMRSCHGFSRLEHYRFADVLQWVEHHSHYSDD